MNSFPGLYLEVKKPFTIFRDCCRVAAHGSRVAGHESSLSRTVPVAQSAETTNTGWCLFFNILIVRRVILFFHCLSRVHEARQCLSPSCYFSGAQCLRHLLSRMFCCYNLKTIRKSLHWFSDALKCNLNNNNKNNLFLIMVEAINTTKANAAVCPHHVY